MNKQPLFRVVVVGLILLAVALSGRAQSRGAELAVNVPFDFNVGERTLPAGDYIISRDFETPNLLIIRRADRSPIVIVHTSPLRSNLDRVKTCLTFNEYQGQKF